MREHVKYQCSCCRILVVTTLCFCCRVLIFENEMIKYFVKKSMEAKETHADFQNTPGDSALSYSTVAKWTSEFKFGREELDVIRVIDGQKVLLPLNLSQKCINGHGGSSTESARNC